MNSTRMSLATSCEHLDKLVDVLIEEPWSKKDGCKCDDCGAKNINQWVCLVGDCLHIGCSKDVKDHVTNHYKAYPKHCIQMKYESKRVWCYVCEKEVFRNAALAKALKNESLSNEQLRFCASSGELESNNIAYDSQEWSYKEDSYSSLANEKTMGAVGLLNVGNTCYMNSAIQALSNTPPLTRYFLDCSSTIDVLTKSKKTGLSRSYQKLIRDMWDNNDKDYVVPNNILYGIRNVHPMFRGYHQHDTQEFLRCFMDQLHEELKQLVPCPLPRRHLERGENGKVGEWIKFDGDNYVRGDDDEEEEEENEEEEEENYETCDSGVSDGAEMREEEECHYDRKYAHINQRINCINDSKNSLNSGEGSEDRPSSVKYRSVISDIFEGKLLSSVQCLACNRVSTRVETFQDLSLPIPSRVSGNASNGLHSPSQSPSKGAACSDTLYSASQGQEGWIWWLLSWLRSWFYGPAVTLHDCLGAFFSADELKDDNMYSCENCNELTNGIKYSKVLELPEVLCIHLKRFRHELMFSAKISTKVSFPRAGLDMRPYIHADCKSDLTVYHLSAVICHTGTAGGGHYTCIARNFVTNKWFQFDDQNVTQYSPLQVSNCEAYVLFYTKSNPSMYQLLSEAADILEASSKAQKSIYISNYWFHRFKMFAEPGPLDNSDFLCEHGCVPPGLSINEASKLTIGIPIGFWDFIVKHFPGDEMCFRLYKCIICYAYAEEMKKRQADELKEFKAYNVSIKGCNMYAISMKWFRLWQDFVHLKTQQPPPPIVNSSIILQPTILDGTSGKAATTEAPTIKPGSDYVKLNEDCWTFLHKKYGGGPEVQLNRILDNVKSPELQVNTVPDNVKSLEQQKRARTGKRKGKTNKKQNTNRIQDNTAALPLTQQPANQNSSSPAVYSKHSRLEDGLDSDDKSSMETVSTECKKDGKISNNTDKMNDHTCLEGSGEPEHVNLIQDCSTSKARSLSMDVHGVCSSLQGMEISDEDEF